MSVRKTLQVKVLPVIMGTFFLGVSCTAESSAAIDGASKVSPADEQRLMEQEELRLLRRRLKDLTLENESLKREKLRSQIKIEKEKKPFLPVRKLKPEVFSGEVIPVLPSLFHSDEKVVADSSQEQMHYYFEGLRNLEENKLDAARKNLEEFLTINPEHPYADRAQYWIARAHYQNAEYDLALKAANVLEAKYPYSFRLADAMYTRAQCYLKMGQTAPARFTLETLAKKFSGQPIAEEARQQWAALANKSQAAQP